MSYCLQRFRDRWRLKRFCASSKHFQIWFEISKEKEEEILLSLLLYFSIFDFENQKRKKNEVERDHPIEQETIVPLPLEVFFKWAIVGLFFIYFQCFSSNQHIFYNKFMWKMSIQYTVPGFELTTFWLWVTSFYHLTRAPTNFLRFFTLPITG